MNNKSIPICPATLLTIIVQNKACCKVLCLMKLECGERNLYLKLLRNELDYLFLFSKRNLQGLHQTRKLRGWVFGVLTGIRTQSCGIEYQKLTSQCKDQGTVMSTHNSLWPQPPMNVYHNVIIWHKLSRTVNFGLSGNVWRPTPKDTKAHQYLLWTASPTQHTLSIRMGRGNKHTWLSYLW